jgi:DedD protein
MVQFPSVVSHTQDDGFHEIQLNGKQLVFLFMAATVVSVVIFLCGVLVGRDVGARQAMAAAAGAAADPLTELRTDTTGAPAGDVDTPTPASADSTGASLQPGELSYFKRLEHNGPAAEDLKLGSASSASTGAGTAMKSGAAPKAAADAAPKPAAPKPAAPAASAAVAASTHAAAPVPQAGHEAPKPPSTSPAPAQAGPASSLATAGGFTLQVAALRDESEATAMADRLTKKGYGAYVMNPPAGAPSVYRVRVGRYPTRHDAETAAAQLKREEQFSPWITR